MPVNLTITRLHVQPHTLGLITARDIREQREAHSRLQQMDGELRRVLASVSDCLWSAEIDGRGKWTYQYISPVIEKLTGQPADFFRGSVDRWASVIHPEDRPRWEKALARLRAGQSTQEEYRVVWPDGSVRWLRDQRHGRPSGETAQALKLDGVVTDVTEQKRSESLVGAQNRVLEMIATGASLPHILEVLVRAVQEQAPSLLGAILLLEGDRLRPGAMPDCRTICVVRWMGRRELSRSAPAARPRRCATRLSVPTSPAIPCGRTFANRSWSTACACAATPILAKNGDVLGVFAAFNRQPRRPRHGSKGWSICPSGWRPLPSNASGAEEALRASEERQARIVETIADGILLDRPGGADHAG